MKFAAAALILSLTTLAAPAADTYSIDAGHTFANFAWLHFGYAHHRGKFTDTKGTVTVDTAKKSGNADVTIQVASVDTGVPKLDEHLKSPDFFDAAKFPTITFKSKKFGFEGDKLTSVGGDLTVHGVTKPVTLKVTHFVCQLHPMMKVPACGADAEVQIKRSEFGMGAYVPAVSDEIDLVIEVEAQAKKEPGPKAP
jgi:polyisoprenoid-binding protein YceI